MANRTGAMVEEDVPKEEEEAVEALPPPAVEVPPDDVRDPKSPMFEDGPTWGEVEAWKKQFGDIYVTTFTPDQHVIWRTVTRFEYKRLVKNMEMAVSTGQVTQSEANFNNEELLCEICVLFPKTARAEMASDMAGIASIISQEVMEASGFVALDVQQL
jgi:hypothetical protein